MYESLPLGGPIRGRDGTARAGVRVAGGSRRAGVRRVGSGESDRIEADGSEVCGDVLGEVGHDEVRAGAPDRAERLQRGRLEVEPPLSGGGVEHRVLAGDVVGGDRAVELAADGGDDVEVRQGGLDQQHVRALLDVQQGADVLMVKPALPYLDIVKAVRESYDHPVAAYNVSGEYAMLHAAAENGWLDLEAVATESLLSIKRAGADLILTYFAEDVAERL